MKFEFVPSESAEARAAGGDILQAHLREDADRARREAADAEWHAELVEGHELEKYVQLPGAKTFANVAGAMRDKYVPPRMLIRDWVVRGLLHWIDATHEAGKTWLALAWAKEVVEGNETVLWIDEELGTVEIANRLRALGADIDAVAARFIYQDFPDWTLDDTETVAWATLLADLQPTLIVIDTATDALTNANVDENRAQEVTRWVKRFTELGTQIGAATLVLDHVPHGGERSRGSTAKGAKKKVGYFIKRKTEFGPDKMGAIEIERTKNTKGAPIPEKRTLTLGGDGNGSFVFDVALVDLATLPDFQKLQAALVDTLKTHSPRKLTTNQIAQLTPSVTRAKVLKLLPEMADSPLWPHVHVEPGSNRSLLYWYEEDGAPSV